MKFRIHFYQFQIKLPKDVSQRCEEKSQEYFQFDQQKISLHMVKTAQIVYSETSVINWLIL